MSRNDCTAPITAERIDKISTVGLALAHYLRNRSEQLQPINLKLPEKLLQTDNFLMKQQTVTVKVERELTRWQKLLQALGLGTFVALCAALLYMAIRIVRKFI